MTGPKRVCSFPTCTRLIPLADSRCDLHPRRAWEGHGWRDYAGRKQLVALVLAEEPTCRRCGAPTTDVNHVKPLYAGGKSIRSNLEGLCHGCHQRITSEQAANARYGR